MSFHDLISGEAQLKFYRSSMKKLSYAAKLNISHFGTRYNAGNTALSYSRVMGTHIIMLSSPSSLLLLFSLMVLDFLSLSPDLQTCICLPRCS